MIVPPTREAIALRPSARVLRTRSTKTMTMRQSSALRLRRGPKRLQRKKSLYLSS
jgi:hypothetical protein